MGGGGTKETPREMSSHLQHRVLTWSLETVYKMVMVPLYLFYACLLGEG